MKNKINKLSKIVFVKPGEKYCPEKEKFKNDLNELFPIIQDAHYSYQIWWILICKEGRKEYLETYLQFKEFFEPVARANLTAMIIALFKLYEEKDNRLSIPKLLRTAKALRLVNPCINKKFRQKMSEAKKIWGKICILRHNFLAHHNYFLTKKEIYKLAKITPNQIKRLIDLSVKIFNTLWMQIEKYPKGIDDSTSKDTLKMLEVLKAL